MARTRNRAWTTRGINIKRMVIELRSLVKDFSVQSCSIQEYACLISTRPLREVAKAAGLGPYRLGSEGCRPQDGPHNRALRSYSCSVAACDLRPSRLGHAPR